MPAPIIAAGARIVAGRGARARAARAVVGTHTGGRAEGGGAGKRRVGNFAAVFMLVFAVLVDLVQILLNLTVFLAPLSLYLTFVAASVFGIWFALLGVSYVGGRNAGLKMLAALGGVAAELVPFINALPATTVSVLTVILLSRLEDGNPAQSDAHTPEEAVAA